MITKEELLETIRGINEIFNLGDAIYAVRERECLGWDGPKVKEYGRLVAIIDAALKEAKSC